MCTAARVSRRGWPGRSVQVRARSEWLGGSNLRRPFRFENMWTRHENYQKVIEEGW
jgi:hypothetical protein